MVDHYKPPHGTYTTTNDTNCIELARLFGITMAADGTYTLLGGATVPDFNKISEGMRVALANELSAMITAT